MTLSQMGRVLPEDIASWRGQQFITEYAVDLHMIGHFEPIPADEFKVLPPIVMPAAAQQQLAQASPPPTPLNPSLVSTTTSVAAGSLRLTIQNADADLPMPPGRPPARTEPQLAARGLKEKRVTFDASLETEVHFAYAMAITEKAKKQLDRLDKKIRTNTQSRIKLRQANEDTTSLLFKEANYKAEKLQLAYEAASYLGDIVVAYGERSNDLVKPAKRNLLAFIDGVIVQGNEILTSWQHNPGLHDAQKPALAGLHQKLEMLIQQAERLHFPDQAITLRQLQRRVQGIGGELEVLERPAASVGIAYSPDKRYLVRDVGGQQYICFCKENGEISPLTITKGDVTSGITTDNYVDFSNAVRQNKFPGSSSLASAKML